MSEPDFRALSSGVNPGGIQGFPRNVKGIFVATFELFLLWFVALLVKLLINLFSGRQGALNGQLTPFQRFRMQQGSKGSKLGQMLGSNKVPPPPPQQMAQMGPKTPNYQSMGPNQPMNQPMMTGPLAPIDEQYPVSDGTQGMNSQIGIPYDSRSSEALSRAADVFWRGFLTLLFVAVINALSFDLDSSGSSANTLSWIFMSLIIIWGLITLFTKSRIVPFLMTLIAYPLAIAAIAVAFNDGD